MYIENYPIHATQKNRKAVIRTSPTGGEQPERKDVMAVD